MTTRTHWTQTPQGRKKLAARRATRLSSLGRSIPSTSNDLSVAVSNRLAADTDTVEAPAPLGLRVLNAVNKLREPFLAFVAAHTSHVKSTAVLAPLFVKTFVQWKEETGGSLAAFCALYDPSVDPADREGYRNHSTYQAAAHLKRIVDGAEEGTTTKRRNAPVAPRTAMARIIASILPVLSEDAQATLYAAMSSRLHWTDTQVEGFKATVDESDPIVIVKATNLTVTEVPKRGRKAA